MGHSHTHSEDHANGHGHSHAPADFGRAFLIGIILNTGFVVIEAVYGWISGSMALIADAGHNLSDVLSLILAWGASVAAKRPPSGRFTYGYKSSTILAALANAALLLIAIGAITYETLNRMAEPAPVQGMTMIVVAGIGIAINTGTALMFLRGRHHDINVRGAFLHMAADAAISLGVVVAAFLMSRTGWLWLDPAVSLAIVVVIAIGTWGLFRESLDLSLDAIPARIDREEVEAFLLGTPGVVAIHDLHIWPLSTTSVALTAHLVSPEADIDDDFLDRLSRELHGKFNIDHATIQIERGNGAAKCRLADLHGG